MVFKTFSTKDLERNMGHIEAPENLTNVKLNGASNV